MVAPVTEEAAVAREVYLPGDDTTRWVHMWTGKHFVPGRHNVDAPIGSPPVFWRDGSDFAKLFTSLTAVRDSIA